MKCISFALVFVAGLGFALSAHAADNGTMKLAATSEAAKSAYPMSQGEVKKVDKQAGKITIKHGPLQNLGMPGMTMAFRVKEPAMLDRIKVGDQIRFVVEDMNGTLTVTQAEVAK